MEQGDTDTRQQSVSKEERNRETKERRNEHQIKSKTVEQKRSNGSGSERDEGQERSESRIDSEDGNNPSIFRVPKRYVLAIMMFAGFMNMYAIRVNLNVAIGAMVKPHPVVEKGRHYIKVII